MEVPRRHGLLFIISAPSGTGKTSLCRELLKRLDGVVSSVSYTTRPARPGEVDGAEYYFVDETTFEQLVAEDALLEYARVFEYSYGTSREAVAGERKAGRDVILEIDWQGGRQVRERVPEAISLFILPPSREILSQRLIHRGQDDPEVIERRLRAAEFEISHYTEYDYVVVNHVFEQALKELIAIIEAERCRLSHQRDSIDALVNSLIGESRSSR